MYYKNFSHSSWVLTDGTAMTALTHTLDTESGTAQITGVLPGLRAAEVYERKGKFVSAAFGARAYPTFSIEANLARWTETGSGTTSDFILGTAGSPYSARVSTIAPSGATAGKVPFACDVAGTLEGTDFGDSADHSGTMNDWLVESYDPLQEGSPSKIAMSGRVLGAITGDFAASEA